MIVHLPVSGVDLKQGRQPRIARRVGLRNGRTHRAAESEAEVAREARLRVLHSLAFPALVVGVSVASLVFLGLLGAIGARVGGANVVRATLRVTFWGALAMALTSGIGPVFGTVV